MSISIRRTNLINYIKHPKKVLDKSTKYGDKKMLFTLIFAIFNLFIVPAAEALLAKKLAFLL